MIVRRVDTAQIKPGRVGDYLQLVSDFTKHLDRHDTSPLTVIRVSSGGPQAGLFHSFSDFDSMEAYGEFIDATVADEEVQAGFQKFFDEDSPCTVLGSNLMIKLASFGAEEPINQPGVSAVVRTWAVEPGHESVMVDGSERLTDLYKDTNGHWNLWQMFATGQEEHARVMTAAVFPNMRELGAYIDHMRKNPDAAAIIQDVNRLAHTPRVLGTSIVRAVAY